MSSPIALLAGFFTAAVATGISAELSPSAISARATQAGNTPLHLAALRNDAAAVENLLKRGADPAAVNEAGATALHYGVGNERIVTALLARGAPVDAVTRLGVTPLLAVATQTDSFSIVQRLIEAGANPRHRRKSPRGAPDVSVLRSAVRSGDQRTVRMLLERGAIEHPADGTLALTAAAAVGNLEMARILLDAGAEVNTPSPTVPSPLAAAGFAHSFEVAQLLIERGASMNTQWIDRRRTPPIVFSGHTDIDDPSLTRLLVEHGADINSADEQGDTALSYALKRGSDTRLVAYIRQAGGREPVTPGRDKKVPTRAIPGDSAARERMLRDSVQRAIDLVQFSSKTFLTNPFVSTQRKCTSCHHQALPSVAFSLAEARGLRVDRVEFGRTLHAMDAEMNDHAEEARQMMEGLPNMRVTVGYDFDGLQAIGYPKNEATDAMSNALLRWQDRDGAWKSYVPRGPMENGVVASTAWSVRAVDLYPPSGREAETVQAVARARSWLAAQTPELLNERVFQLLGLAWANASAAQMQPFTQQLIDAQRPDGSWAQLSSLPGEAWTTGSALVALYKAGISPSHAAYQRGIDFLLRTQFDDGSWWVRSRSWPTQAHFNGKFPHGKDQWISAGGTAWAMIALLNTLDPTVDPATLPKAPELIAAFAASPAATAMARRAVPAGESNALAAAEVISFARDIQPILERSCVGCHSGARPKGAFNLTTRETLLKGGQSGEPAVLPGYAAESQLIHYASDSIEDLEMPPLNRREKYPPLSEEELERLRTWIDAGVQWPADAQIQATTAGL